MATKIYKAAIHTLRNDFHNTAATVRVGEDGRLSPAQVKRTKAKLCGVSGCTCSGELGTRGPQDVRIGRERDEAYRLIDQGTIDRALALAEEIAGKDGSVTIHEGDEPTDVAIRVSGCPKDEAEAIARRIRNAIDGSTFASGGSFVAVWL